MKAIVAFDETGHTGANLLDPDQPVFALASVQLSDDDAARVLGGRRQEIKFVKLKRSRAGRKRIMDILDSPYLTEDCLLVSGLHKPFVAVAKIVDLLVEPLAYEHGVDLYERGANLALANMMYFCFPVLLGQQAFNLLRVRFVGMVRAPSLENIAAFYAVVDRSYAEHRDDEIAADLAVLLATRVIAERHAGQWGDNQLDPSIPAFVHHASTWTQRLGAVFTIIHDQSKPIVNSQVILEAMMSTTDRPVEVGYDRRKTVFPIAASGIEFCSSDATPQLQVADVLAGSAGYCLRASAQRTRNAFATELLRTRALAADFLPVWPEPKVTPEQLGTTELGGIDAIDFMTKYVSGRLGGILPGG